MIKIDVCLFASNRFHGEVEGRQRYCELRIGGAELV